MSTPKYIITVENSTVLHVDNALKQSLMYNMIKNIISCEVVDDTDNYAYSFKYFSENKINDIFLEKYYSENVNYINCHITFYNDKVKRNQILNLCKEMNNFLNTTLYMSDIRANSFEVFNPVND